MLDAALDVLGRDPDASMAAIADAAGLTRTTVYRHFPSREDLARALFDQVVADAVGAVETILASDPDPETFLRALAQSLTALGDRYRFLDRHRDLVAEWRRDIPGGDEEPVRRWARGAAAAGALRPGVTPDWLGASVGALSGAAIEEVLAGRATLGAAADELADTLVAAFLAG